jgi:Tfp pilus assembly protein PilO
MERRERYLQEVEELRAEVERRRARLLPSDKAPLAASELQNLVKKTAQDTGVEVRSERVLPPNERGGYTEVPVEVTLSGPVRAIASFLHRLEATPVLVAVQDVKVRVVSVGAPRELLATLAVAGYIATGADTAPRRTEPARRPGA